MQITYFSSSCPPNFFILLSDIMISFWDSWQRLEKQLLTGSQICLASMQTSRSVSWTSFFPPSYSTPCPNKKEHFPADEKRGAAATSLEPPAASFCGPIWWNTQLWLRFVMFRISLTLLSHNSRSNCNLRYDWPSNSRWKYQAPWSLVT